MVIVVVMTMMVMAIIYFCAMNKCFRFKTIFEAGWPCTRESTACVNKE